MSPLKRVLAGIALLVMAMIVALLVSWRVQERALSEALVRDVKATLASPIERTPKLASPKHENGFACLSRALATAPGDLRPLDMKDQEVFHEILDAGVVPDEVRPQLEALEPWAESLRECGDSERLAYVPGFTPFEPYEKPNEDPTRLLMALQRMTRVQARLLPAQEKWVELAQHCAGTLEVSLDFGHVNLLGAMVADAAVHQLTRACAAALQQLPPDARPPIAARFGRLPARLVSNAALMERERQLMMLSTYRHLLSDEQLQQVPQGVDWFQQFVREEPMARFFLPRIWSRWDRSLRELAEAARAPGPARESAAQAVDKAFSEWWIPATLGAQPNYEKFFARNDEAALLLQTLVELAADRELTLSAKLVKTPEGLEFTRIDGEKLLIPLVR